MEKRYEGYSETDWANEFLADVLYRFPEQFPDVESRIAFRRTLDINNIQKDEVYDFWEAYQKGKQATDEFLEKRKPPKQEAATLPEEKQENKEASEKQAA